MDILKRNKIEDLMVEYYFVAATNPKRGEEIKEELKKLGVKIKG